jgi:epoxide hydrolase-like predicted phosphatase
VTIRAVYFDLGGVIVRTEFDAPRQHLADRFGMELEDIYRIVFGKESIRASVGEITEAEYWAELMQRLHLPVSDAAKIEDEFFAGDVIDRDLLDFMRGLREKFRVGLISNAWSGLRPWIASHKFEDAFDVMVISSEVGIMKPDPRIFQYALEQLDVAPEEAVFVDDVIENVEAARQLGMQAIHFVLKREAINKLKLLLAYPL